MNWTPPADRNWLPGDDPEPKFDWKCCKCGQGCSLIQGQFLSWSDCCGTACYRVDDTYPKQFRAEVLVSDGLINALESISRDGDTDADGWAEVAAHVEALKMAREKA